VHSSEAHAIRARAVLGILARVCILRDEGVLGWEALGGRASRCPLVRTIHDACVVLGEESVSPWWRV
jgi:hypothetical protein